ncbi:MAG: response regulator [Anaerolineae bacterium]|jgi:pilus assembly protein CpaE
MNARILVAEDDFESLRLIGLTLESHGYEIIAAQDGTQALEKAVSEIPDLVILDVMMPGMDGHEVCRRLRADPRIAHIPVMMFTAKTQVADKVAGFEAGADEYVTKPIHPTELASRVEALLSRTVRLGAGARPSRRAKVIGFLGCKGGVGTTTLVVNVGVDLVRGPAEGKRVMLLDLRPGGSTLSLQLGLQPSDKTARLLEDPMDALNAEMIQAQMDQHVSGLMVLGGMTAPMGLGETVGPARAEAILEHLGNVADYVLVDMGADLSEVSRLVLQQVDYLLLVVEPQRIALTLTQVMLASLDRLEVGPHRVGLVMLQRARSAASLTKGRVENFLQREVKVVIPPAPELAFQAADSGMPMVMVQAQSLVVTQLRELADIVAAV